ncbi:DUF2336 domain-containing protein [Bradyrhizobium sp.]|uniref:DUF2336 domain-containing protein n=1 Tax=Bradyrhizobium sp. TaxID=376 RepID=UPI002395A062|nr:DUF2336 domain-containing protein [Bradyrhizobium sp.]MDE1932356.1 DUF2336 domain-containing protein [Bradyrhizobium sp.]MDE2061168.1 DUF2336 domain-containing protein [Bradyrhizobium sp.]
MSVIETEPEATLITELEAAVRSGSSEIRVNKLRQVTSLFLAGSGSLTDEQVKVFDDVLCRLMVRIETQALAELGRCLAPVDNAPAETIKRLAWNEAIAVAGPVLTGSKRLSTVDLTEIAQVRGQAHLAAISRRESLETAVTDVLVERGDQQVLHTLARNTGARFSDTGYAALVEKADGDDMLSEAVGSRRDIPVRLLRDLLARATEAVKARLLALIPPAQREQLTQILLNISTTIGGASKDTRYANAERAIQSLQSAGRLNDTTIHDFAVAGQMPQVIVGIAVLTSSKIDVIAEILTGVRNDAVLVPCKAAGLGWATVEAILCNRLQGQPVAPEVINLAKNDYDRLSVATAQKTLRFLQVRATVN